ncbi:hypothetical protein Zmor_001496 [Zophobas morio]|uniref:Secreted protein n=1 Tax=Zophobas morio TaxID=2755281 RepID=A0AA38J239_9CUCU|nr:hypothetical protein Zmor_001496 [Zophobas morio]
MLAGRFFLINILIALVSSQVTKVVRTNPFLSRKKRYLTFPENSNFVITLSYIKAIMVEQPRGWNALGECDVPFALPNDTRLFKNDLKARELQKRAIFNNLNKAFSQ